jgi:hypothetical protein
VKITGAEFIEWYTQHFPSGYRFDPVSISENKLFYPDGSWKLEDDVVYDTDDLGYLTPLYVGVEPLEIDMAIRQWMRREDYHVLTVRVPRGKFARVKKTLASLGCKLEHNEDGLQHPGSHS